MKIHYAQPSTSVAHFPGKHLPLLSPSELKHAACCYACKHSRHKSIYESPDRGLKVWDGSFRFRQRWCQLASSRDFPCQVIHEAVLAPAAQETTYTCALRGRSSASLTACGRHKRKSGNAKRKGKWLLPERNWEGKRWVLDSIACPSPLYILAGPVKMETARHC